MNFFKRFKQKGWSVQFAYDDSYQYERLLKGELKYKKDICKLSEKNYLDYINSKKHKEDLNGFDIKTIILINGEIRNPEKFIRWVRKIKDYAFFYIYTDKSSYQNLDKNFRDYLESISSDLCFSEEDSYYQENLIRNNFQNNMRQWLKLKQSIHNWQEDWLNKESKTILRMRTDIAFLNPNLLENYIKNGFTNLVKEGQMIGRSDLLFAFNIKDAHFISSFYDEIFSLYFSKDWIKYPFLPLNPETIIKTMGGTRIEWNNFPSKYIGINPTKHQFFERISFFYDQILFDYKNYLSSSNYDANMRFSLFGKLSSVRNISSKRFSSEKCFAHYLTNNGITISHHHGIFSGKIIREESNRIKLLKVF